MSALVVETKKKNRWADEEDEEDVTPVKPVAKSKVKEFKLRVPLRVKARRGLPRFGDAKVGEENVTIPSRDFVSMEHPDDQINEDTEDPALAKTLANFISKQAERGLNRDMDIEDDVPASQQEASSGPAPGKYVAPGARAAALAGGSAAASSSGGSDGTETTLRVSNLTKAVTEDDLRDLFGRFGRIYRIYLPRDAVDKQPRGYAYIAFDMRRDAELAMDRLQGYGYDHLIIKIEWAKPVKDSEGGGGGGGGMSAKYMSGYGTALAQDTKDKVTYFSSQASSR